MWLTVTSVSPPSQNGNFPPSSVLIRLVSWHRDKGPETCHDVNTSMVCGCGHGDEEMELKRSFSQLPFP